MLDIPQSIYRRIRGNRHIGSVAVLTTGSCIGYAAVAAASPLITRLFMPEHLGAFALMMAILNALSPVINGHYDYPIVSAETDDEAVSLTVASVLFGLAATATTTIVMALASRLRPGLVDTAQFFVIPLLALAAIVNPLTGFNNRNRQYRLLATVTAFRSIVLAILQVLFGFIGGGVMGLVAAQLASSILGINIQARFAWDRRRQFQECPPSKVLAVLRKHYEQPLYSAPALLLGALAYSAVTFMISALYGLRDVGYYSMSFSLLGLPLSLLARNVSSVFLQHASREKAGHGNFARTYRNSLLGLSAVAIPAFGMLMLVAEPLFGIMLGKGWDRAGRFVAILSPMFAARFVATSLVHALFIGNRQRMKFMLQMSFTLEVVAIYACARAWEWPIERLLMAVAALFSLTYAGMAWISWQASREQGPSALELAGHEVLP